MEIVDPFAPPRQGAAPEIIDPFAQPKQRGAAGIIDPFAKKTEPESTSIWTDAADFTKRVFGSTLGGIFGAALGAEQAVKGAARSAMEGTPEAIMPASVYQPGLDTEDALFGYESKQERARRKFGAQQAVAGLPNLPGARSLNEFGKEVQKTIEDSVSEKTKRAIKESTPTGNIFKGELSLGENPTIRGYAMQGASVFGSLLPVVLTAIATKSPTAAGGVGGAMAAEEAASSAAEYISKLPHEKLLESSPFYASMIEGGATEKEARDLATRKAAETGAVLQGMVATLGDRFTGKLVTGAFDDMLRKVAGKSVLARTGVGAGLSAVEEAVQEVSEGVAADIAVQNVVRSKEIGEDSAANLILGALGGSGPGGYRGLKEGLRDKLTSKAQASVLEQLSGEQDAIDAELEAGRAGATVAGRPADAGAATRAGEAEPGGVVPTGEDVGEPPARAQAQRDSLDTFQQQYNDLRNEYLELASKTSPTQADTATMRLIQRDLNEIIDGQRGVLGDKLADQISNPTYDANREIDAIRTTAAPARATQGQMFTPVGKMDLANRALSIARQNVNDAVQYLVNLRERTAARLAEGVDADWGRRNAATVGMSASEGFNNPEEVARRYIEQTNNNVTDAIQRLTSGKPRAMQGDLFGQVPEKSDIDAAAERMASMLEQRERGVPASDFNARLIEEFGAPVEGEVVTEEAAPELTAAEKASPVRAPLVSTEHVAATKEGSLIKRFFDAIRPAATSESEQEKHRSPLNTAASTMLDYDIAEPGQETSEGARQALSYLVGRVGGQDRLDTLLTSLENSEPDEQAALFGAYGLPNLSSRRGMETFSSQVQQYFEKLPGKEGGVRIPTRSTPVAATGEFQGVMPYTEEMAVDEMAMTEFGPMESGRPRAPELRTFERLLQISDTKLRKAVQVLRQTIASGAKLSPEQQAARTYIENTHRSSFGQALRAVAFDLATYSIDPRNHGANSTFTGEGGRYAENFYAWINANLDQNTIDQLNDLVEMYKSNVRVRERHDDAMVEFRKRLDEYSVERVEQISKTTGVKIPKAPRKARISERVTETEAEEAAPEAEYEPPKVPAKNLPRRQVIFEVHPAIGDALKAGDTRRALELMANAEGNPYYASLAQRLLDAGITAKTRLVNPGAMESLDSDPQIKETFENQLSALADMVVTLFPQDRHASIAGLLGSQNLARVSEGLDELRSSIMQYNPADSQIQLLNDALDMYNRQFAWVGKYDPNTDSIVMRTGRGITNHTYLHEALHAATAGMLDNPDKLSGIARMGYDQLQELYNYSAGMLSQAGVEIYGLKDLHEFVSEALTNPEFQAMLRAIRYKASPFTLMNRFTDSIRKLFNIKPGRETNVLEQVIFATDAMMGYTSPGQQLMSAGPARAARRKAPAPLPIGRPNTPKATANLLTSGSWSEAKKNWPIFYANLKATMRPAALGALTLRQIADLVNGRLPQLDNFLRVADEFMARKNRILNEAGEIAKRWERLQGIDPEMSQKLGRVMHAATIREFDPDPSVKTTPAQRAQNADILNMWKTLTPEARQIYRDVRNFYAARYSEYKRTLNRRIVMMRQLGVSEATINEIRAEFDKSAAKGPYFPLRRYGRFAYQIGKGTSREYYMFESLGEMETHMNQRLEADPHLRDTVKPFYSYKESMDAHARESNFLRTTFNAINSANFTGSQADIDAQRQNLKDQIYQTWLSNQPENSFRRQFMHRSNIEGFSQDALRNFSSSSFNVAYQLARFEYSPEMFSQLNAAKQQLKGRVDPTNPADPIVLRENNELNDYIEEADRRLTLILNPTDIGTLPSVLSNIGFIWYLTAPASAIFNVLGGMIIGLPTLVGQQVRMSPNMSYTTATLKALGQMKTVAGQIMATGFSAETGPRIRDFSLKLPSLNRSDSMSRVDQAAYDRFVADGLIDITASYDQSGLASSPTESYHGLRHKSMQVLTYLFHNAERFNREVIAMSAFRAAMEKRAGMTNRQQAFTESIAEAKDVANRSMFDYSTTNKPRYFQHPVARVVLQFKQFPQQMTYFLTKSAVNMFNGQTPEVRREARARFVGTMGMAGIFSGVTGLWGFSTVAAIVNAVVNGLGGDDEEPFDFELEFANWAVETFGKNLGTMLTRGIGNAAGIDIASRVKLDDMWFRDSRKGQDEVEAFRSFLVDLLGPTIGLSVNVFEAAKLWNQGHSQRAIEMLMPAFIKNPLVAARYANEGVNTLRGDPLMDDMGPFLLLMQSLGIRSAELAERQYYNMTKKGQEQDILTKRQNLLNLFGIAFMANDVDGVEDALDKINEFTAKYPSVPIPIKSILRSIDERIKKSSQTDHGLYIDQRLQILLNETYLNEE